jgi:hypothetical protein
MRTTLTLDDDVAAKLRLEAQRSGRPFREVVNDTLRKGMATAARAPRNSKPFVVKTRDLGRLRPGISLDNVSELIEQVEGPLAG